MKKKTILSALLLAGGIFALAANPLKCRAAELPQLTHSRIWGTMTKAGDDTIVFDNKSGESFYGEIIIHISEDTKILDAVNGFPVSMDSIGDGQTAYAYIGPAMTMSLPPQTNSPVILTEIPADYKVPDYVTVKSAEDKGDTYLLTAADGAVYSIPKDCSILPYLTRNIVRLTDLTEGSTCLIWSDANSTANKIVLFAGETASGEEPADEMLPAPAYGWFEENGQIYFRTEDGSLKKGFIQTGNQIFFLNPETGAMQTGPVTIGDTTYHMFADGTFRMEKGN